MDRIPLHRIDPADVTELDELLQSGFWAAFKSSAGWKPYAFRWKWGDAWRTISVLERRIAGFLPIGYVPMAPSFPGDLPEEDRSLFLDVLAREFQGELSMGCLFVRFDLPWGTGGPVGSEEAGRFPPELEKPLRRAPYRVQPPDTVLIDLTPDEEDLLAGMHKKTRYNIRLAAKKGVTVKRLDGADAEAALGDWYALYEETARRDGLGLHVEGYYRRLFELAGTYDGPRPELSLYLARHEETLLAGIIVARHGRRATYLYGASSDRGRELMPNHLLQWEAIRDAKAAGTVEYDLFGIPPSDDPDHPMHGLYRFKTGFGGQILHRLGAWDRPFSWSAYPVYRAAEAARGRLAAARKRR